MTSSQTQSASYSVGYGKPPRHTQFRKGQSGNPGGRPQREPVERLKALTLQEAYRAVVVMEDGRAQPVSALQAILRSQIELAMKGNIRAQRDVLTAVRTFERQDAEAAAIDAYVEGLVQQAADLEEAIERAAPTVEKKMSYVEAAQRITYLLGLNKSAAKSETGAPEEPARAEKAAEPSAPAPPPAGAQRPENGTASAAPPAASPARSAAPPVASPPPSAAPPVASPPPSAAPPVASPPRSAAPPAAPPADALRRSPPATGRANRRFSGRGSAGRPPAQQTPSVRAQPAAKIRRFPDKFPVLREPGR